SPFFFMIHRPQTTSLFPYTTLFRSEFHFAAVVGVSLLDFRLLQGLEGGLAQRVEDGRRRALGGEERDPFGHLGVLHIQFFNSGRSEEHTSELQSRENLVCRLLLVKK